MAKKKKITTTEVALASQAQDDATLEAKSIASKAENEAETGATEEPKVKATETANTKAIARVKSEYDTLKGLDAAKRDAVFGVWASILHSGEATEAEYKAALAVVATERAESDNIAKLNGKAESLTATAAICRLVAEMVSHVGTYKGRTPRLVVSFDVTEATKALDGEKDAHKALKGLVKFGVLEGQAKRGRKAGSVGSNSRISAWEAAKKAAKDGDEFAKRFKKNKDGPGYRDMGAGIGGLGRFIPAKKDGGLVAYIFSLASKDATIAKSALVKKLAKYNADKAADAGISV